jgi:hypothetical protein
LIDYVIIQEPNPGVNFRIGVSANAMIDPIRIPNVMVVPINPPT